MKPTLTILLLALAAIGCQAAPPLHKTAPWYAVTVSPTGNPWTGGTLYHAHFADTSWTPYATYTATNGQTVLAAQESPAWDIYTSDSTNVLTGAQSDYANVWTNSGNIVPIQPTIKPTTP